MTEKTIKDDREDRAVETLKALVGTKAPSAWYEIFFSTGEGFSVEVKEGEVDALKVRSTLGVGLRTITDSRAGFGFSTVFTDTALEELVEKTLAGGRETTPDTDLAFPGPDDGPVEVPELGTFDPGFGSTTEEGRISTAREIESSALGFDPRIKRVRKASYRESAGRSRLVNSKGVDLASEATFYSGSVTAVAEGPGGSEMGFELGMGHIGADVEPEAIGTGAARRATELLGAEKMDTIRCPAVLENMVACELLESLAGSFRGDNVAKGKSMLAGKVGREVVSRAITLWDDGLLKGGWAASPFDGEGAARTRTALLTEGVLQGYLYDTYWALRAKVRTTGNAARGGFKTTPMVGISNLYIEKGEKDLPGLLSEMDRGFLVTELLGVHTINSVTGDFSLGASGFWVEGGKHSRPVRGMAVAGNLLELFSRVVECGSDLRFIGSIGAPSLMVSEIEASGA